MNTHRCEAIPNCSLPIDIILQSSDGKRFGAHTKNLEFYTDAFPAKETVGIFTDAQEPRTELDGLVDSGNEQGQTQTLEEEIVKLTESSNVLLLLLQFSHKDPPPDVCKIKLDTLLELGMAADKYGMYLVFEICRKTITSRAKEDPLRVLVFKAKYQDHEDIDVVARLTMDMSLLHVLKATHSNPEMYYTWTLYHDHWKTKIDGCWNVISAGPTQRSPDREQSPNSRRIRRSPSYDIAKSRADTAASELGSQVACYLKENRISWPSEGEFDNAIKVCQALQKSSSRNCDSIEDGILDPWKRKVFGINSFDSTLPRWTEKVEWVRSQLK